MLRYEASQQSVAQRDSSLLARNDNYTKSKFNPPPKQKGQMIICPYSSHDIRYGDYGLRVAVKLKLTLTAAEI